MKKGIEENETIWKERRKKMKKENIEPSTHILTQDTTDFITNQHISPHTYAN